MELNHADSFPFENFRDYCNDFLSKLNFSTDIYPFFAVYEQELNMGMSRILNTFSFLEK